MARKKIMLKNVLERIIYCLEYVWITRYFLDGAKKDNVKICLRTNNLLFGVSLDYLELMLFRLLFRKTVKSNFLQPPASTKFSGFR